MPAPPEPFGVALRRLRERSGLTQEQLAERAGLSPRAIRALEGGERLHPYPHTIRALAEALDLGKEEALALGTTIPKRARIAGQMQAAAATRTLPRDVPSFTGRARELARLLAGISDSGFKGPTVAIGAIDGMAGVGKTAFAVHVAHRLASEFPDGQLFVDLRAHTAGQRPVAPEDALASLLLTIGVPGRLVPRLLDERVAMWRDRLVGKRMLIVLDNAAATEQIRPLLPGVGGCLTLITSRRRLAALEDVVPLTLGTLPIADASELLARLIGPNGVEAGSDAASELVGLCGQLPLAIRILAGRLRSHPTWSVRDLVSTLKTAQDRLAEMRIENLAVEATFDLSYRDLTSDQQHLFRRLALHPGLEIDAFAAAALNGGTAHQARRGLDSLFSDHLLEESSPGRYRFHDLVHDYARDLAQEAGVASNEVVMDRLLDYYLHSTVRATQHLVTSSEDSRPAVEYVPTSGPDLTSRDVALTWLEAERTNLSACAQYAATNARETRAVQLAHAMQAYLQSAGHWDQLLANSQLAVAAARRAGDVAALATGLMDLAEVQRLMGDYVAASTPAAEALSLFRETGDRFGEARALFESGRIQRVTGLGDGRAAATASLTAALDLFRNLGERLREADTLKWLGTTRQEASDYASAAVYLTEALALFRDLDDRTGEAGVLLSLGRVQFWKGEYRAAAMSFGDALEIYYDIADPFGQANVLNDLGRVECQLGEYGAAAESHSSALDLFREFGSRIGEENALAYLGVVQRSTGEYTAANASLRDALAIARRVGDLLGSANVLTDLATAQRLMGQHTAASASVDEALAIARQIGDRVGEAEALNCLGTLLLELADPDAIVQFRNALDIARDIGCRLEEARALEGIGLCRGPSAGIAELQQALELYERMETPDASRIIATLRVLRRPDRLDSVLQ